MMGRKPADEKKVQMNLTIHPDLKAKVEEAAEANYMSVSQWVTVAINRALIEDASVIKEHAEVKRMISESVERFFDEYAAKQAPATVNVSYDQLGRPGDPGDRGLLISLNGHGAPFLWDRRAHALLGEDPANPLFLFVLRNEPMGPRYEVAGFTVPTWPGA